jgi:hypothetical protein
VDQLNASGPIHLDVYVAAHCWQCPAARTLAAEMAHEFPALVVRVIDLDRPGAAPPAEVFAVPSFLLNGKTISLGTPAREGLARQIRGAFERRKDVVQDQDRLFHARENGLPATE